MASHPGGLPVCPFRSRVTRPSRSPSLAGRLILALASLLPLPLLAQPMVTAPLAPPGLAVGFDRYVLGASRAQVPTTGLRCGPSVQAPTREVCAGTWWTASPDKVWWSGIWLSELQLVFADERLVRIDAIFDSREFERARRMLERRYGEAEDGGEVISGGYGIRIAGDKRIWRLPEAMIIAREAAGVLHYSSVRFLSGVPPPAGPSAR